jgi:hypothetical protein
MQGFADKLTGRLRLRPGLPADPVAIRDGHPGQVIHLDLGCKIAGLELDGMPQLAWGTTWDFPGRAVFATPHLKRGEVSVIDLRDWHTVKRIETQGPGDRAMDRALRVSALLCALAAAPLLAAAEGPPLGALVLFNTQCARCHEGECSGRLSFQLGEDAADGHIRRYAGAIPLETVRHLGDLLRHMKEGCAFYPMPLSLDLATDRTWGRDTLDGLRTLDGTAYFLPLGRLGVGRHDLWIEGLDPGQKPCIELVDADFDPIRHEQMTGDSGRQGLRIRVEAPAEVFLRIRAQGPIALTRVDLGP